MRIAAFDTAERVLIVAEIGNNHEGDPATARQLVQTAADVGAHAVKLQTFRAERVVRRRDAHRFEQLSSWELEPETVQELSELAHSLGLLFLSTPLDLPSVDLLAPLVDAFKIASGDNDFVPLVDRVAEGGKPVIVSTGLVDLERARAVKERIARHGPDVAVLHAVTAYPAPAEAVNLAVIAELERELDCTVGYSDHTLGNEACLAAVAAGARIVEKHFTLDHEQSDFRDHKLSADPAEMRELVDGVTRIETLLGQPSKALQEVEAELELNVRRSIAAGRDLPRGHVLEFGDLAWLRPRDGLAPGEEHLLVGRALRRDVTQGETILATDVS